MMRIAATLTVSLSLFAADTYAAKPNIIRNGGFEDETLDGWQAGENVTMAITEDKARSGKRAIKLTCRDVAELLDQPVLLLLGQKVVQRALQQLRVTIRR